MKEFRQVKPLTKETFNRVNKIFRDVSAIPAANPFFSIDR